VLPALIGAAGEAFRALGMGTVSDNALPTVDELLPLQEAGRAWVATDQGDHICGVVLVDFVDGLPHIEQVSVHPSQAGHGVGRDLLQAVAAWAGESGYQAMTLTTFTEVPWNGPYYERLGWRRVDPQALTPALEQIRINESAQGLDRWPRAAMRYTLRATC
jgi:GNAT superfamily N-acetyltransferase